MMEALCSSETSVVTRATRRHIPEDRILYSYRRENLKSSYYMLVAYYISAYYMAVDTYNTPQSHVTLIEI
jgi:hypothetical protein